MQIKVRHAIQSDLEQVFAISRSLGQERDPSKGFLVSDYPMETYETFYASSYNATAEPSVFFLVACDDVSDRPAAFLIAYSSEFIVSATMFDGFTTERRLIERFGADQEFTVIKQISVDASHIGQGLGSKLYDALFHALTSREKSTTSPNAIDPARYSAVSDVFVAIMRKPENQRSARFHASYGFLPVLSFGNPVGEPVSEREVLHVTAQTALQFKRDSLDLEKGVSGLRTSLENATMLYLHEDNLNWTKLQYMSQYFAALVAAQFILPTLRQTLPEEVALYVLLAGHLMLTVLLGYVLQSLSAKIRSGLRFMASHKRAVLITEAKLQHRTAAFYPAVSRVPRQSRTVILISFAKIIFGSIWVLSFIMNLAILVAG